MPEVFTGTPIEAHIVAVFMQGQLALAALMRGTPVFRNLLWWVLGWSMIVSFVKMASHKHDAGRVFVHIIYRTAMVWLALSLLGRQYPNVQWSSMTSGPWSGKAGVNADRRYQQTIGREGTSPGLQGYVLVYGAMNNFAAVLTNTAANAFGTASLAKDPVFLHRQLARMGAMALPPELRTQYDALIKNCSNRAMGRIVGPYDGIREWLNMTDPQCAQDYADFDVAARSEARTLFENSYPQYVREQMAAEMVRMGLTPTGTNPVDHLSNVAMASALFKSTVDREGRKEMGLQPNSWFGARNSNANGAATFSDGGDRAIEESASGFFANFSFMNMFDGIASLWGGSAYRASQKATMANQFNQYAPLIPSARGFMQGLMAIFFVLAVYSIGFGTWKWAYAWLMAQASLCLYKPVAVLGYKVADYFAQEQKATEAIANMASSPLVLSGVKIFNDQVPRIQTVYLAFEIGVFVTFMIGAIAAFRPVTQAANRVADSISTQVSGAAGKVFRTAGATGVAGAAGASAGVLTVARGGGMAASGEHLGAVRAGGVITPSAPPPGTWESAA